MMRIENSLNQITEAIKQLDDPWVVFWGGVFPGLVALAIAITPYFLRFLFKENLAVAGKLITTPHDNGPYFRIPIINKGKASRNTEGTITIQTENGISKEGFIPLPLEWTHGWAYKSNGQLTRDIQKNQTVLLDLVHWRKNENRLLILSPPIMENRVYQDLIKGKTNLELKFYSESGRIFRLKIKISWDGKSDPIIGLDKMQLVRF